MQAAAWYSVNANGKTHEVGKRTPNAWGLYDMHGNVVEWCWDRYGAYTAGAQTDPTGAVTGLNRVERGGSWGNYGQGVRSAYRESSSSPPSRRASHIGFRLARP